MAKGNGLSIEELDNSMRLLTNAGWKQQAGLWRDPLGQLCYCPTIDEAVQIQAERMASNASSNQAENYAQG
jgi:hypothetical protein